MPLLLPLEKKIYRSSKNKVVGGVCGGFADYFNVNPTVLRILVFLVIIFSNLIGLIIYSILWLVIPSDNLKENKKRRILPLMFIISFVLFFLITLTIYIGFIVHVKMKPKLYMISGNILYESKDNKKIEKLSLPENILNDIVPISSELSKVEKIYKIENISDRINFYKDSENDIVNITYISKHPEKDKIIIEKYIEFYIDEYKKKGIELETEKIKVPTIPFYPNERKSALMGLLIGMAVGIIVVVLLIFIGYKIDKKNDDS
jgi:phage shock protein PspC (stress-responsive transcriptional regulator)/capsular polysaccharide biosynthesis protein